MEWEMMPRWGLISCVFPQSEIASESLYITRGSRDRCAWAQTRSSMSACSWGHQLGSLDSKPAEEGEAVVSYSAGKSPGA